MATPDPPASQGPASQGPASQGPASQGPASQRARTSLAEAIRTTLSVEASASGPDRITYSRDLWPRHHIAVRAGRIAEHRPACIAWPESTEQVAALVAFCAARGIHVVPFGAGSGVCGGVLPSPETLVIDVKKMQGVRKLAPEEGYVDVEAGVMGIRLEEDLQHLGHTVGHFPSSILCSTVGGWLAARGAGQCSGLYGKIEDMTAAIELVDGRGEIVTLRRRLTGPDMTPLIVGSEGILGVITATQLRLHAAPARRGYAAFSFPTMEAGYDTIRRIYQAGLRPAVCRLYDPFDSMMAKRGQGKKRPAKAAEPRRRPLAWLEGLVAQSALRFPGPLNQAIDTLGSRAFGGAMLVLLTEGDAARVEDETPRIHKLCLDAGGEDLGEGPARHWLDRRYAVSYRQAPMFMMGTFVDTMEVAAPWARFGDLYEGVRRALGDHVMVMAHMSHAYPDGCSIYFTFAGSAGSDEEAERIYDEAWRAAAEAAIAAGGTLSHHHGVGRSKAPFLSDELGLGIEVVRAIKGALDPDGILNPSNLLPADDPARRALPPPLGAPRLDEQSETVEASGKHRLEEVEAVAAGLGLSLGLPREALGATVGEWLGAGAPGAPDPWLDPTDHLVAGYRARLPKGAGLEIRPCPRRAVGPDLWALFAGTGGRAGTIESAHLRVRGPAPRGLETPLEREPAPSGAETAFIDRVLGAVAAIE